MKKTTLVSMNHSDCVGDPVLPYPFSRAAKKVFMLTQSSLLFFMTYLLVFINLWRTLWGCTRKKNNQCVVYGLKKWAWCLEMAPHHLHHLAGLFLHVVGTCRSLSILLFTPSAVLSGPLYQAALGKHYFKNVINPTKEKKAPGGTCCYLLSF